MNNGKQAPGRSIVNQVVGTLRDFLLLGAKKQAQHRRRALCKASCLRLPLTQLYFDDNRRAPDYGSESISRFRPLTSKF
jgi:hypothetical protein